MRKETHEVHQFLDAILHPLTVVHNKVLVRFKFTKRASHITLGGVVMVIGSVIAGCAPHDPFIFHVLVDVVGYYLHGMGAAPIIKVVLDWCGIEGA